MVFKGLVHFLYSKVLIGLNLDMGICQINIVRTKNGVIKQNIKTNVKILDDSLPIEIIKLIQFYKKKYPFTYIGVLSKTYNQGVAPITNTKNLQEYGINIHEYHAKVIDNSWCAYIKNQDCVRTLTQFQELGYVDLVFSPFIAISTISRKEKGKTSLFILQEKKNAYIAIGNGSKILYGGFFNLHSDLSDLSNLGNDSKTPDRIPTENQTFEDILDSISENLDAFDEFDLDLLEEEYNEEYENHEKNKAEELKDFMRATTIVGILESTIKDYYSRSTQQNSFIEQIVILDTYGITQDAIKHIRDSLMIDTYVQHFSIPESLTLLMLEEIKRGAL